MSEQEQKVTKEDLDMGEVSPYELGLEYYKTVTMLVALLLDRGGEISLRLYNYEQADPTEQMIESRIDDRDPNNPRVVLSLKDGSHLAQLKEDEHGQEQGNS